MSADRPLATRADLPAPGGRVHFMGIGGAGMRGLAVLFDHEGYVVDGCDRGGGDALADLTARGIPVEIGHDPAHVEGIDLLVRTSAVPADAPEVAAAEAKGIPVMRRARALGALMNDRDLVGLAGTHGKTTITGMTGCAAEAAGLDPLVLVGGNMPEWGGFVRLGRGPGVVEADEFDRSFLQLDPTIAVVSSLEAEHLDTYGDFEGVRSAFETFARRADGGAGLVYCVDDPGAADLAVTVGAGLAYGFAPDAWCRIHEVSPTSCGFEWPDGTVDVSLQVPGRHNQQNAAAAFVSVLLLGGDPEAAARGLAQFRGAGRRLERLGTRDGLTVIDDYAHHPTEVTASLSAVRAAYPNAQVTVVFQPHLYTRTRDFYAPFAAALEAADDAWVLPIYPAREPAIEGVTSALITDAAGDAVQPIDRAAAVALAAESAGERVLIYMGAGDVTELAHEVTNGWVGDVVGA